MCGITGFSNFKKNIENEFEYIVHMSKSLAHRGPDSYDYFKNKNSIFAHRRLSIVDPVFGSQPMVRVKNGFKYTIVYNGEIYNTKFLREDLLNKGYEFESYSDTEVLLFSYIHYKEECVKLLNGIFAFAIFDEENQKIFMARDHLGVKPLFYSIKNDYLIFASEIKALLKHPLISSKVSSEGILDILSLGPSRSLGHGIFKDINEIPPAHYLIFSKNKFEIREYWTLNPREHKLNAKETSEEIIFMMERIIKNQMVSDREIFGFLSGGIDSSLICSILSKELREKGEILNTFTVDYVDYDKDFKSNEFEVSGDKEFVKIINDKINTNNKTIVINNQDLFYYLENSLEAIDLPSMADIDSSLYLFCKEVKNFGVVGFSGECADEIFGGYPWYLNKDDLLLNTFPWSRFSSERKKLFNEKINNLDFDSYISHRFNETFKNFTYLDSDSEFDISIRKMTLLNIKWFMVTLLNRKDRMSMGNSLEIRVPFADKDLVEYAYNIPSKIKFLNMREKGILREASRKFLPDSIVDRKKSPYPKTQSGVYTDLVCAEMKNILRDKSNPIFNLINEKSVRELVDTRGESHKKPWFGQLMRGPQLIAYLIQLNMWIKKYNVDFEI